MSSLRMLTPTTMVRISGCTFCHQRQLRVDLLCIVDNQMEDELPPHAYTNNYGPDFRLHIPVRTGKENLNSPERIAKLRNELLQNISRSAFLSFLVWLSSAHHSRSQLSILLSSKFELLQTCCKIWSDSGLIITR